MENSKKRGRPVGSTNKKSNLMRVVQMNKNIKNSPVINSDNPYKWVTYGKNNNYDMYLLDLYHNSTVHSACVDFIANAIIGDGVDYQAMQIQNIEEMTPNYLESWDELLSKISLDLVIFGGYALQIIKNRNDKTYSFFHQPFSTVRFGKKDENGEIKKAYISKDWSNYVKYQPLEIDVLNYTDDVNIALGKPYLLVYTNYNIFDEYYPNPHYTSALEAIESDIKLKRYDLNAIMNNFSPSGVLTLNPVADADERKTILDNIQATFSSEENANNLLITFRSSNDDKPVDFTPIASNVDGVNMFADTNERNMNRILSAHRLSKGLIGLPVDDAGFSSEGAILEAQFNLANILLINNLRKRIVKHINTLLALNGIDVELKLKPLKFNIQNVEKIEVDRTENIEKIDNPEEEDVAKNNNVLTSNR